MYKQFFVHGKCKLIKYHGENLYKGLNVPTECSE